VDNGLIFYQHEMPEKPFWLAQDAIRFRVVTPTTISDSFILLVLISFEARCPQRLTQLWRNAGKEGEAKLGKNKEQTSSPEVCTSSLFGRCANFRRACSPKEDSTVQFPVAIQAQALILCQETSKIASILLLTLCTIPCSIILPY